MLICHWRCLKVNPLEADSLRLLSSSGAPPSPLVKILHFNFQLVDFLRLPGAVSVGAFHSGELI